MGYADGISGLAPVSPRAMFLFFPLFSLTAATLEHGADPLDALAVQSRGRIVQCSPAAAAEGVQPGDRVRQAQSHCPQLEVWPYDRATDERHFAPVTATVEQLIPQVYPLSPGRLALPVRGPARYFGSEQAAAEEIAQLLADEGFFPGLGVSEGLFVAEHAAQLAAHRAYGASSGTSNGTPSGSPSGTPSGAPSGTLGAHPGASTTAPTPPRSPILILPPGRGPAFAAELPVHVLAAERVYRKGHEETPFDELAQSLTGLGLRTLGEFAAFAPATVLARFGPGAIPAHQYARGIDPRPVIPRALPPDFSVGRDFDPPLERSDQLAFSMKRSAEEFIDALYEHGLVATGVDVILRADNGTESRQRWNHPRYFGPDDVLDRLRWQLDSTTSHTPDAAIAHARFEPGRTVSTSSASTGLWGSGPEQKVHHSFSRVQSMLGHRDVLTAHLSGGRTLAERQIFTPWGEAPSEQERERIATHTRPWPGALPAPAPSTVFAIPEPVRFFSTEDTPLTVTDRGTLNTTPALFLRNPNHPGLMTRHEVTAWSAPLPLEQRWWDGPTTPSYRLQVVDADTRAWLLIFRDGIWFIEGSYD